MATRNGSIGPPIRANTMEPEVFRQLVQSTMTSGVVGTGDLLVSQTGTASMGISVAAGFGFVPGQSSSPAQGLYHVYNDAAVTLAIASSDPTNPRIDLVVATIQDAYYSGASNQWVLQVITGTPAGSPVVPATPTNSIALATVNVAALASSIVNANLTDLRTWAVARNVQRLFAVGSALSGAVPLAGGTAPFLVQAGTIVVTTNSSGVWALNFPTGFPNGLVTVLLSTGDGTTNVIHNLLASTCNRLNCQAEVRTASTGALVGISTYRVNWIAIGW